MKKGPTKNFDTIAQASEVLGVPVEVISAARAAGAECFRSGRIDRQGIKDWIRDNPEIVEGVQGLGDMTELIKQETHRKLKIANDIKERMVVPRAEVVGAMHATAGALNTVRARSEAEDAMLFAETMGDPTKCRSILRDIWVRVFASIAAMGRHFEEMDKGAEPATKAAPKQPKGKKPSKGRARK